MSSLFIVSTPIGNLSDITLRAIETLSKVGVILCEDTRKTGLLLKHHEITKKELVSFYEENEKSKISFVIDRLKQGEDIALVSSAGTPLISDPGFKLVRECVKHEIRVIPIPGASALLACLVVSGLAIDKFMFLGFLPKKQGKKEKLLKKALDSKMTIVFYESPFRILKTLELLKSFHSRTECVIGRELTKKFEEILRGTPEDLLEELSSKKIKGEIVVVVN